MKGRYRPLALAEVWRESYSSILARPVRAVLTSTTVKAADTRSTETEEIPFPFNEEAIRRARELNGVTAVGAIYTPVTSDRVRGPNPAAPDEQSLPIAVVSSTLWDAVGARITQGRAFDDALNDHPVCLLGRGAAANLGIESFVAPTAVEIGGRPFTVLGILDDVERQPQLRVSVIVPMGIAAELWGEPTVIDQAELVVTTQQGAAQQVSDELQWAISPGFPEAIAVEAPPDPRTLRESVSSTLRSLLLGLGAVALLIGTFGIANSTMVSVMERRSEIGLRRALGASRGDIARQVALESSLLGAIGGITGATLGMYAVIVVAWTRGWSPILNLTWLGLAPAIGVLTGLLAGAYPAAKAARIEPAQALRST